MIKLTELLKSLNDEENKGMVNVDDWRWPDIEYLISMKFELVDDYRLAMETPPIVVYKKKDKNDKGEETDFFFVEEPKRGVKRFREFNDVIDYFDSYSQPEIDKNRE